MTQVIEIQVHASTGFNHPYESYANFKPGVTLRATLTEGTNVFEEARKLQSLAESLVQVEKKETLIRLKAENDARVKEYSKTPFIDLDDPGDGDDEESDG